MTRPNGWTEIRAAAYQHDWNGVAARAEELGWLILAWHARRARFRQESLLTVGRMLRLDQADPPDPLAEESGRAS